MGLLVKILKGCWKLFTQVLVGVVIGVVLLYLNLDTVNGLFQALSESGIGFLAWWQAQAPITNSRLVMTSTALIAVLIAQPLIYRRFKARLLSEKGKLQAYAGELELTVSDLTGQLEEFRAPPSPPVFEPNLQQSMVIRLFWQAEATAQFSANQVGEHTTLTSNESALILEGLCRQGLLLDTPVIGHGRLYSLSEEGRKFAAEMVSATDKRAEWPSLLVKPVIFDGVKIGGTLAPSTTQQTDAAMQLLLDALIPNNAEKPKEGESSLGSDPVDLSSVIADLANQIPDAPVTAPEVEAAIRRVSTNQDLQPLEHDLLLYFAANPNTRYSGNSMRHYFKVSASEAEEALLGLCNKGLLLLDSNRVNQKPLEFLYLVTSKGEKVAKTIR
ncbi:hypothetical protein IB256_04105 [Pseudomonas sp. PDM17]|uniref:hypothetical protein n=1 Tax=Pseudomonas sp. PDM17 TaxID=2769285 RepID=UPI00177AA94C|nr:hypothetical protein [Pseudomonas sp. PDM17]MBD9499950.1 hypothetical protein [Pseudomonas sp. PDM17]